MSDPPCAAGNAFTITSSACYCVRLKCMLSIVVGPEASKRFIPYAFHAGGAKCVSSPPAETKLAKRRYFAVPLARRCALARALLSLPAFSVYARRAERPPPAGEGRPLTICHMADPLTKYWHGDGSGITTRYDCYGSMETKFRRFAGKTTSSCRTRANYYTAAGNRRIRRYVKR